MALEITDSNYKEVLAEGKPVVVDFWAPWCGPCKMVAPIIEELAAEFEGQVIIGKCDVDENGDMAAEYGIRNIPTVLFFKNGEIVDKQVGAVGKPVFAEKVKKLFKEVCVSEMFLYPSGRHTGNHHAQCHKSGSDSIVRRFVFTFRYINQI